MSSVVIVGAQWGDEGKGKIVDIYMEFADVVVRYAGGPNAGHTLVVGDEKIVVRLLPSGILRERTHCILGQGMVIDTEVLLGEIDELHRRGHSNLEQRLSLSDRAHLILPYHILVDTLREGSAPADKALGTTKKGIGPAYEDKVGRRAIRAVDLKDLSTLPAKVARLLAHHNALRRGVGAAEFTVEAVLAELTEIAPKVLPFIGPVWRVLDQARKDGKRILFEGAQAVLLDVDHGTYPYVTSSNTVAGQAAAGSGIGPRQIGYVLGIVKAYTTRVGDGPFPTEQTNAIGERLGTRGAEFGTVTGRKRRCGWFDAVLVRQTIVTGGVDGIALTKLDVLDGFDEIKVCVGYTLHGKPLDYLPADAVEQAGIEAVYETIPGWSESTRGARSWAELPANAVKYVRRIEELIGAPVALLSTSPEREDTILVHDPFLG